MRIVLALGGNALLQRGEHADAPNQRRNVELAAASLAGVAAEHEVIVTHGNGRQVGLLAELALRNELPERDVVSVLTEVVVAADDPAFLRPTKPIGPVYTEARARELARRHGWTIGADGDGYRRLVPSPEPHAIAEIRSLRVLVDSGALVVCAGGGGVPVALDGIGTLRRVEAVVDKDLTAALLARRLDADLLVMLTDVDAEMEFAAGSMGPKVEAACRFAEASGRRAAIGSLRDAAQVARGEAGTQVSPGAGVPAIDAARRRPRG